MPAFITSEQRKALIELYIGYFNRAPEAAGLSFWAGELLAALNSGKTEAQALASIADRFYDAGVQFGIYSNAMTVDQFITTVYQNVLGRNEVDAPGMTFWKQKLDSGAVTRGQFVREVIQGAKDYVANAPANDPYKWVGAYLDNRVAVGEWFANNSAGLTGQAAITQGTAVLQNAVTPTTAQNGQTTAQAVAAAQTAQTAQQGQTFTLTVDEDSGPAFVGTAGNDTFEAPVKSVAGNPTNTLSSIDKLDGGEGTDTLNVTLGEGGANAAPSLTSIENVTVRFANTDTLDLSNATGVTTLKVQNSTSSGTVEGLGGIANLQFVNQNQDVDMDGSTATTLNLTFNKFGTSSANKKVDLAKTGSAAAATTANFTLTDSYVQIDSTTADAFKTVTIAAAGTNKLDLVDSDATIETLTITGAGSVDLTAQTLSALKTLTAGDASGAIKVKVGTTATKVTTGSGKDKVTYTAKLGATADVNLGAGDDILVIAAAADAGAKANGGDGKDTLVVADGSYINTTAKGSVYSSFEYLDITGGDGTYDVANLTKSTIEKLVVGQLAANKNATVNNLAAGAIVDIVASTKNTSNGNLTIGVKDASTTTDDHLKINIGGQAEVTAETVTAANVEKVTINSTSTLATWADATNKNTITALTVANATDGLFITGDKNLTITAFTGSTNLTKIDASAFNGKLVMGAALITTSGAEIIGGSKDDTILGTANGDVINGGKGADAITLGASGQADTLIYAAGDSLAGKFDVVTNFTSAEDTIDLGAFSFSGTLTSAIINKGNINTTVAGWDKDTASVVDFFKAGGVQRAVAISTNGSDTYVIVDVNKNGNFDATTDLVIKLIGTASVVLSDFGF